MKMTILARSAAGTGLVLVALLVSSGPVSAQCGVWCRTGAEEYNCGENTHVALSGSSLDRTEGGSHTTCWAGVCCWESSGGACEHECCVGCQTEEENEELATLIRALDTADWSTVRHVIANNADQFTVNHARQSVQVSSNCQADVVLINLPIPVEHIAYVSTGGGSSWTKWYRVFSLASSR